MSNVIALTAPAEDYFSVCERILPSHDDTLGPVQKLNSSSIYLLRHLRLFDHRYGFNFHDMKDHISYRISINYTRHTGNQCHTLYFIYQDKIFHDIRVAVWDIKEGL